MKLPAGFNEKAAPYCHAFLLAAAFALGGLRSPWAWLAFGALLPACFLLARGQVRFAGLAAPALFFAWLAAAALFSTDPGVSAAACSRYAALGLLFFSAAASGQGEDAWLAAVLALGAVCAAVLLAQRLIGLPVTGLIGANPNYSAVFAAAAFPAAALGPALNATGRKKLLNAALCALLASGLAASGSRGAVLSALVSAAAGLAVCGRRRRLIILAGAVILTAGFLPGDYWEGLLKFSDPRAFARPHIWLAALKAAAARPFFGWGPGLFGEIFETFKFPYFDGAAFYGHSTLHAHSEVFNLAAEAGYPAAFFFLLAAVSVLASRGAKRLPVKLCALAVLLEGSVDMIFYSGAVGFLFWGSLGFAAGGEAEGSGKRTPAALPALICLAALAAAQVLGALAWRGDIYQRAAAVEAAGGENSALALALARRQALLNPKSAFMAEAEGRAFAAAGDAAGARGAFKRALALEPLFAQARLDLAELYSLSGDQAGARGQLALALRAPGPAPKNAYQSRLLSADPQSLERLEIKLWPKLKIGTVTAPLRKTP